MFDNTGAQFVGLYYPIHPILEIWLPRILMFYGPLKNVLCRENIKYNKSVI